MSRRKNKKNKNKSFNNFRKNNTKKNRKLMAYEIVYRYKGSKKKYIDRFITNNLSGVLKKVEAPFEIVSIHICSNKRYEFLSYGNIKFEEVVS